MTPRFRIIAGPNGSGKTTLCKRLAGEFAVNFYTMLNPDEMFLQAFSTRRIAAPLPISTAELDSYVADCSFPESVLAPFLKRNITLDDGLFKFLEADAVNTYTISLITNFIQDRMIVSKQSFSQETVFSHPSKIDALQRAKSLGFRTYLYFIATESPQINAFRVRDRVFKGGHDVPADKIISRFERSLRNVEPALPFLSRAFFFDNSEREMRYVASYDEVGGWMRRESAEPIPKWFRDAIPSAKFNHVTFSIRPS